jgi:hypothetical protein
LNEQSTWGSSLGHYLGSLARLSDHQWSSNARLRVVSLRLASDVAAAGYLFRAGRSCDAICVTGGGGFGYTKLVVERMLKEAEAA